MKIYRYLILAAIVLLLFVGVAPLAAETQELKQKMEVLEQQLNDLQKQLSGQRQDLDENRQEQVKLSSLAGGLKLLGEHVTISGCVEVEVGFTEDYDGNDESDITLATVELGIDIDLHKYVSAHILLLWEEDDTEPVDLDEAYLTLGNTEHFPVFLQAGKFYVPFGNFESHMISDPLTLELGETRESAVLLGFEQAGFRVGVYAFNGDIDEAEDDNEIKCFGLSTGYAFENDNFSLDVGADWINNLADSDTLGDALPESIRDYVDGFTAHAVFSWQGLTLIGEYLAANDDFAVDELEFKGKGAKPEAWNVELGYTFAVAGREAFVAVAWQGTDEALALELPEDRYLGSVGVELFPGIGLALEYAHDEDYGVGDGGSGKTADTVTLQLALEF
ncbi:MAG TPA: LbtU family siderophore porin [Proteobacteria bacterium]|nr:LbtU family siderophore porin [Pseudomonadota bacterium]